MSQSSIQRELGLEEVISRTFDLYRRHFSKFVTIYLVFEAIIGVLTALARYFVVLPPRPGPLATRDQILNWFGMFAAALFILILILLLVNAIFGTIATGATIKMSSESIQNREPRLADGIKSTFSRLLSIWVLSIITLIIIFLGLIALIVPGIILAIMFALALPALLIEKIGIFDSMGRSRQLVSGRWLKSLALYIVIGIIILILSLIGSLIVFPIGNASIRTVVSSLISALYAPIIPIMLTVYYYSNVARITPTLQSPAPTTAPTMATRFCPSCGEPITELNQAFCKKCGRDLRQH